MKWIDMPPVWLIGALVASWYLHVLVPSLGFGAWSGWVGTGILWLGFAVLGLAAWEFLRAKTTIVPRQNPSALINGGIYRYSRNPIYLADALILTGLILRWDAVLALPLIPAFIWIIQTRFIIGEEAGLDAAFAGDYAAYRSRTRRWI